MPSSRPRARTRALSRARPGHRERGRIIRPAPRACLARGVILRDGRPFCRGCSARAAPIVIRYVTEMDRAMSRGRKPLGDKAMTAAERQAKFREAHQDDAPRVRATGDPPTGARARRDGAMPWTNWSGCKRNIAAGSIPCRRALRAARRRKRCARSATSIYPSLRAWSRRAALGAIEIETKPLIFVL